MTRPRRADTKAQLVAAWADPSPPVRVWDAPLPSGVAAWKAGQALVLLPELLPGAPASIRRAYRDRLRTNATGRCPRCGAASGIDTASGPRTMHEQTCPVAALAGSRWLDRRGIAALGGRT